MNRMRKGIAALLCALLVAGLLPTTAMAVYIKDGTPAFTKKSTTVSFAGHEWWVIDTGSDGVTNPGSGSITLLEKNGDFSGSAFRTGNSVQDDPSWTQYSGDGWYYAGSFTDPSDYNDSTLMNALATATDALSAKEAAHITARALDNIVGVPVSDQKLWPLSFAEFRDMGEIASDPYSSLGFGSSFWLRSPYNIYSAFVGLSGGGPYSFNFVGIPFVGVRPALHLNLASVLFTSDASAKSSVGVADGLVGAAAPTGNLKFTMLDSSQAVDIIATTAQSTQNGGTLTFNYANGTAGTNQFVSCVLVNNSNVVTHYGKLKDSSTTANGTISIPLAGVADGTYTLRIFSEEANSNTHTDFCSTPVEMTVEVASGSGTVSNFGGTILSNDASLNPGPDPIDTTPPTILSVKATPYGSTGAVLEVVAADASTPLRYQWQVHGSWIDIPGATSARFDYTGLEAGKSYTVRVLVTDVAGNRSASNPIMFTAGASAVTGLPDSYTLLVGQSVKWTPVPTGGSWSYDNAYLSMTESGGAYTFKVLKEGKTTATYTASGVSYVVSITVNTATLPQTGDMSNPLPLILLALASLTGLGAVLLFRKKLRA